MANYYTEASFMVHFESAEKEKEASHIYDALCENEDVPCMGELAMVAQRMCLDREYSSMEFRLEPEENAKGWNDWWVSHDETINVDQLTEFLSYLVEKDLLEPLGFEWSHTCSKARLNSFGGGAVWITKESTDWCNTGCWLAERQRSSR